MFGKENVEYSEIFRFCFPKWNLQPQLIFFVLKQQKVLQYMEV